MSDLSVNINGQDVFIEVESNYGTEFTGVEEVAQKAQNAFEKATETIASVSKSMVQTVRSLPQKTRPDEFSLEFGIKFKMDGSIKIAAVSGEATLAVKMVYKNPPDSATATTSPAQTPPVSEP